MNITYIYQNTYTMSECPGKMSGYGLVLLVPECLDVDYCPGT